MKIPKTIHYCWFGNNPKSKVFEDCLVSWKEFCPDFEIKEWNESNTKQFENPFYKNALRKKQYAFVADYIRAMVLFEEGGVYLDTDMLLLKPIYSLLKYNFFIGEEVQNRVNFALFGSVQGHRFLHKMIEFYNQTEFNVFSPPVITHTFSPIINRLTITKNGIIFEPNYFYPLPYEKRFENYKGFIQPESYAVHLWDHSWAKKEESGLLLLFENLKIVIVDFIFYKYSFSYFKRYSREFFRKIVHYLIAKKRYR